MAVIRATPPVWAAAADVTDTPAKLDTNAMAAGGGCGGNGLEGGRGGKVAGRGGASHSQGGRQAGRAGCGGTGVGWVQVHEDKGQG